MPIITLTTDFGTRDGYVGAVKGVIARIAPDSQIIDIAHDVPRGDIAHAAWVVATSTLEFPHGTIHVVVVDPGVGGARAGIIGKIDAKPPRGEQFFIGPDNGVFGYLRFDRAYRIEEKKALAPTISPTFHGRDVFAYVAGGLANDKGPSHFGNRMFEPLAQLPWGKREPGRGRVVHIDHYGNLITDLPASEAPRGVIIGARTLPLVTTYESVAPGQVLAYVGSANTIEIAVRDGNASAKLSIERGEIVDALPAQGSPSGPYR